MPFDRSRYPPNWKTISLQVRKEAGWACEWCGITNGTVVIGTKGKPYKIVLTVAHLGTRLPDGTLGDKHNKLDVRRENLAALCQPCHLRFDMAEHQQNAAETRRKKKLAQGQMELIT